MSQSDSAQCRPTTRNPNHPFLNLLRSLEQAQQRHENRLDSNQHAFFADSVSAGDALVDDTRANFNKWDFFYDLSSSSNDNDWLSEFNRQKRQQRVEYGLQQGVQLPGYPRPCLASSGTSPAVGAWELHAALPSRHPWLHYRLNRTSEKSFGLLSRDEFLAQFSSQPQEYEPIVESSSISMGVSDTVNEQHQAQLIAEKLRSIDSLRSSDVLRFVDSLARGHIRIQDQRVIDTHGNSIDWAIDSPYSVDLVQHMESVWKEGTKSGLLSDMEVTEFRNALRASPIASSVLSDSIVHTNDEHSYKLQPLNPYVERSHEERVDLMALARRLIREGRIADAILALEAEVHLNRDSSEGWRLLGELHADNEQDIEAIQCLKKGHETDPFNLSSMLSLGVSLANEMNAEEALTYLKIWLQHHEHFEHLVPINEKHCSVADIRSQVTTLFQKSLALSPNNADLHTGLGIIYSLSSDLEKALAHFVEALRYGPSENCYSLWNKIGATLANSGNPEAAVVAYKEALRLKPNYPRSLTNLGIAHANLDRYDEAVGFFLSAISLNPRATHLWNHVRTAMFYMGRYELLESVDNADVATLRKSFPKAAVVSESSASNYSSADKEEALSQIHRFLPDKFTI